MIKLIQEININQKILKFETWRLFDQQFESNSQRKNALIIVEEIIALITNSTANKSNNFGLKNEFLDDNKENEEDKEDEKEDGDGNIIICNPTDDDYEDTINSLC